MKIDLHIERLILDGLPVSSLQGAQLRTAIEKELTRLLSAHGLSNELRGGIAVPRVRAGNMQFGKDQPPAQLGQSIARAVYEGIGNSRPEKPVGTRLHNQAGVPR
jgi:hypothetical protein